jgi:Ca-activated chloride channel family protein
MLVNRLILLLAIIAAACIFQVLGQDASSDQKAWYDSLAPEKAGVLAEEASLTAEPKTSCISIVDLSGAKKRDSLELPALSWARLRLEPAESGVLTLFCRYPTGSVAELLNSSVDTGKSYTTWQQAGYEGDYELWYTVGESRSNSVKLNVSQQQASEGMPLAASSGGGGISRSYNKVAYAVSPAASAPSSSGIGLSAGGAKDINNFRENIENGYLPLPTDLTYEGLFYDYYFETGALKECKKLFCPSYSYAISRDPISGVAQYYLSVGLNSGIEDFQRKKLNLVVVLDFSGSMGSPFDEYYYDQFGNRLEQGAGAERSTKTKMQIADESVVNLLGQLKDADRFGLVIFSDDAFLVDPLTEVGDKDMQRLKSRILKIKETGGTNMESGMEEGTRLFDRFLQADKSEYENRIIFLTDAMPNMGETTDLGLYRMLQDNAEHGIYTTFIGIGVDFNTELTERITKIKGSNYYSVHSASEFQRRLVDEFDYMVTPLVFDLRLKLDAPGYEIEKVYGSPEADQATGELMKVATLFPSKAQEGNVKGGVVLVKLKKLSGEGYLKLKVSYQDRSGVSDSDEAEVFLEANQPDFYENNGIRKAVLLTRYADLLKNWMIDERSASKNGWKIVPSVTRANGIVIPVELGDWERQSLPLTVSEPYRLLFSEFMDWFKKESQAVGDSTLQQEEKILEKLGSYQGTARE